MTDQPWPIGQAVIPEEGVRLILAPNPSPMTCWGTNSYIIGTGDVALIDPGPLDDTHAKALLGALAKGERISHIFVTHAHLDHSALARPLAEAVGARIYAFGPAGAGRSARMAALEDISGGEGVDRDFRPDCVMADGETVAHGDWALTAWHTPGHMGGHLCFGRQDALFTGDHVMGWAPSLVSPPDGDMGDYMAGLHCLAGQHWRCAYPAHGGVIADVKARVQELIGHRLQRKAAILADLAKAPATLDELTMRIYADLQPPLIFAAKRTLLAHLIELMDEKRIMAQSDRWLLTQYVCLHP